MTDTQRIFRDLLKEVVEVVNRQSEGIGEIAAAVNKHTESLETYKKVLGGVANELIRTERKRVARLGYDPSSGCCHGRKR